VIEERNIYEKGRRVDWPTGQKCIFSQQKEYIVEKVINRYLGSMPLMITGTKLLFIMNWNSPQYDLRKYTYRYFDIFPFSSM
jgi:hypothetical protein